MARPDDKIVDARKKMLQILLECKQDPALFAEKILHYKPFDYNIPYLRCLEKFVILRSGRKVGKTYNTAAKAIHFAWFAPFLLKTVDDVCEILIVAPTQNQANIMFGMIKTLVHRDQILESYIIKEKADELWLGFIDGKGISKIYTRAAGERGDSIRGYAPHVIIADEASYMNRDVMIALMPAGLATDARLWMTSSPNGKVGYFYDSCANSRAGNPSAASVGNKEHGLWMQFHASSLDNPEIKRQKEYIKEIKRTYTEDEYIEEVLGEFSDVGNALIPRALIVKAVGEFRMPSNVHYAIGVDIAGRGRDETVYVVIAYDDNGNVYMVESKSQASSTTIQVAEEVESLVRKYRGIIDTVYMDNTGLGSGAVDQALDKGLPARGIDFSSKEKNRMYKTLVLLFENGKIKLGGDSQNKMVSQLGYLKKEQSEVTRQMRIVSAEHDDYPDALALACNAVDSGDAWDFARDADDPDKPLNIDDIFG